MDDIKKLINLKLLNILCKVQKTDRNVSNNSINNYVNKNLIKLTYEKEYNNNIKDILLYLLNNDGNFLLIYKNLKEVEDFMKKKYNLETNEEELNNIIIEYIENHYN